MLMIEHKHEQASKDTQCDDTNDSVAFASAYAVSGQYVLSYMVATRTQIGRRNPCE